MKSFWKKLDKILGILLILALIGGGIYIGFFNRDALKPTYDITLDPNGGTLSVTEYQIKSGNTIELPELSRDGYTFDGWFVGDTKWESTTKVDGDTTLVAKWTPLKYTITFVVNGLEYDQATDYDSIPVFLGSTDKTPTQTTEYTFSHWVPEIAKVTGNTTYTAVYTEAVRKFNINITSNFLEGATYSGSGKYEYGENATISVAPKTGYVFLGWYKNGSAYSTETTIHLNSITEDISLEAQFSLITKQITYLNAHGTIVNPTTYNVTLGTITLLPQNWNGYNFVGWFTEEDGNGEKIETIDTSLLLDYTLYAHYEIITYTISYDLAGGTLATENPCSYKITDPTFTLNNPTLNDHNFIGWSGTDIVGVSTEVTISNGSFGHRSYTAIFQPIYVTISFQVDGMTLSNNSVTINRGEKITAPIINSTSYGMSGYNVNGWYTNEDCTTQFNLNNSIRENTTLYGTWVYLLDTGFYAYITEFNEALTSKSLNIDSEAELISWVEFVSFYCITDKINLTFSGPFNVEFATKTELTSYVSTIINKSTFPNEYIVSYGSSTTQSSSKLTYLFINTENIDGITNASLTGNPDKIDITPQQDYALLKSTTARDQTYNNFNINNVSKTLTVETSNQLVYALSCGLNPICQAGSPAENIYNKAKTILREIVNDNMTNLEKVRAIYDWLILNVSYDTYSANSTAINNSWQNYDSWYAEGVFNNNLAVCDGYAKAFIILTKIENIPAIRVTGNEHAWNKVYIDGTWYGIDATHGDLQLASEYEVLTYSSFLFTDEQKATKGYTSTDYSSVVANTYFNYYDYESYTINIQAFDLIIESSTEFDLMMNQIKQATKTSTYLTIEFAIDKTFASSLSGSLQALASRASLTHGLSFSKFSEIGTDSYGNQIYLILIT